MSDTVRVGVDGGASLREALRRDDPRRVISEFQERHGLNERLLEAGPGATYRAILPLLDLHGVARREVYAGLLNSLKHKLVEQMAEIPEQRLLQLLEQCFRYIHVPELQPVVLEVLKHSHTVPVVYLQTLAATPELLERCPISTKRQVWTLTKPLFRDHITPMIDAYVFDEELEQVTREFRTNDATTSITSSRRSHPSVQRITEAIGSSIALYNEALRLLRLYYVETGHPLICALRADILMELHHADVVEIYKVDPCHMLAWSLDACVRHNSMEPRRIKEIQAFFDGLSIESAYGDIAMIIADPRSFHMLVHNVIALMHERAEIADNEAAELEDRLHWMIRFMSLGNAARNMIRTQKFKVPKLNQDFFSRFEPMLIASIRDHSARTAQIKTRELAAQAAAEAIIAKNPSAPVTGSVTLSEEDLPQPLALDPALLPLLSVEDLARRLLNEYILSRVIAKDLLFVRMALKFVSEIVAPDEDFLQSLGSSLGQLQDQKIITAVMDFLLPLAETSPAAHRQAVHAITEIAPRSTSAQVQELVTRLIERGTRTNLHMITRSYQNLLSKAGAKLSPRVTHLVQEVVKDADTDRKSKPLLERTVSVVETQETVDIGEPEEHTRPTASLKAVFRSSSASLASTPTIHVGDNQRSRKRKATGDEAGT